MNDSLRTNVFTRFHPEVIACACIYLAARQLKVPLPSEPAWWLLMGADEDSLQDISRSIVELYQRNKPNIEELEAVVNELKKGQMDARLRAKELRELKGDSSQNATPESFRVALKVASPVVAAKDVVEKNDVEEVEERPTLTLGEELNRISKKRHFRSRSKSPKDKRSSISPEIHQRHRRRHRHRRSERSLERLKYEKRLSDRDPGRRDRFKESKDACSRHHSTSNLKRLIDEKDDLQSKSSPDSHDSKGSMLGNGSVEHKQYIKPIILDNGSNNSSEEEEEEEDAYYNNKQLKGKRHKKRKKLSPSPVRFPDARKFKRKHITSRY